MESGLFSPRPCVSEERWRVNIGVLAHIRGELTSRIFVRLMDHSGKAVKVGVFLVNWIRLQLRLGLKTAHSEQTSAAGAKIGLRWDCTKQTWREK